MVIHVHVHVSQKNISSVESFLIGHFIHRQLTLETD